MLWSEINLLISPTQPFTHHQSPAHSFTQSHIYLLWDPSLAHWTATQTSSLANQGDSVKVTLSAKQNWPVLATSASINHLMTLSSLLKLKVANITHQEAEYQPCQWEAFMNTSDGANRYVENSKREAISKVGAPKIPTRLSKTDGHKKIWKFTT